MNQLEQEPLVRTGAFLGVFLLMALWEMLSPLRRMILRRGRWPSNLGIVILDSLLVRFVFPVAAVAILDMAKRHGEPWLKGFLAGILRTFKWHDQSPRG